MRQHRPYLASACRRQLTQAGCCSVSTAGATAAAARNAPHELMMLCTQSASCWWWPPMGLPDAEGGDRPVYAMQWAAAEGVVPLDTYPYVAHTDDCQGSFESRAVTFAGAQAVDMSKADNILQVIGSACVFPVPSGFHLHATFAYNGGPAGKPGSCRTRANVGSFCVNAPASRSSLPCSPLASKRIKATCGCRLWPRGLWP